MLSDDLDKKIREAAEQHHPAYDENAWRKMEKLLSIHMPVNKDRRRRFLLIFLFALLLGGGIVIGITGARHNKQVASRILPGESRSSSEPPSANSNKNTSGVTKEESNLPDNKSGAAVKNKVIDSLEIKNQIEVSKTLQQPSENSSAPKISGNVNSRSITRNKSGRISNRNQPAINKLNANLAVNNKNQAVKNDLGTNVPSDNNSTPKIAIVQPGPTGKELAEKNLPSNEKINNNKVSVPSAIPVETKKDVAILSVSEPENKTEPANTTKPRNKKKAVSTHSFAFTLSAGPDLSKAGGSAVGKLNIKYGLGVNYNFNRFTLSSGVYLAKKVYAAAAKDYQYNYSIPSGWKFVDVQADCKVLSIPINLVYNFANKTGSGWFAGAGISTYLMQHENYNFHYSTSGGQQIYYMHNVIDKNKNYFSVLNLTGGYNRQLSKKVSLSIQPYLEIPLQGIGEGKVLLNSGGLLFTIGLKSFSQHR
jgi:hypothetical protein